jgi:hypothetical protein
MHNAQGIENGKRTLLACRARQMCQSVGNVLLRVEMRKECEVLKNIANLTFGDGQVEAGLAFEENAIVDRDASLIGGCEAGDAVEQRRLPCPGRAKQNTETGLSGKIDLEREFMLRRQETLAKSRLKSAISYFAFPRARFGGRQRQSFRLRAGVLDNLRAAHRNPSFNSSKILRKPCATQNPSISQAR